MCSQSLGRNTRRAKGRGTILSFGVFPTWNPQCCSEGTCHLRSASLEIAGFWTFSSFSFPEATGI
jgi:hypothetical protein